MQIHLRQREIHSDGVFHAHLRLALRVRDLDVTRLNRQVELAGTRQQLRSQRFIRCDRDIRRSGNPPNVFAKLEIFEVNRREREKHRREAPQHEYSQEQPPER